MRARVSPVEALAAAVVTLTAQAELSLAEGQTSGSLVALRAGAVVAGAGLVLVRAWPLGAVLVTTAGLTIMEWVGEAPVALPFLVLLFVLANLGWRAGRRDGLLGIAVAGLGVLLAAVGSSSVSPADLVVNLLVGAGAWLGAHLVRVATDRRVAAEVAAHRLADEAVAHERTVIARDLHDTLAHAVSVMTLQAGAARQNLDDTSVTRTSLLAIERSGRAAMQDLHRFLSLLHADGERESPTLADLPDLVEGLRATGCDVALRLADSAAVPLSAQTTAFRVVQESLTNAMKHQQLRRVDVAVANDPLTIQVRSYGTFRSAPGGGRGLRGMRARVEAFGGTCTAAAEAPQTWLVSATLPTAAVQA